MSQGRSERISLVEDSSIPRSSTTTAAEVYTPIASHRIEDNTQLLNVVQSHPPTHHRYSGNKTPSELQDDSSNHLKPRQSTLEPSIPSARKFLTSSQSISSVSDSIACSKDKGSSMKDWLSILKSIQIERSTRRVQPWENSWDAQPQPSNVALNPLMLSSSSIQSPSSVIITEKRQSDKIPLLKLADLTPFFYTSPGHDTLLLTKSKDLIVCAQFKDQLSNLRRYRLCIRSNSLHRIEIGEISEPMVKELDLIANSVQTSTSSIFSVKDYSPMSPHLASHQNTLKHYSIYKLPSSLHKCYQRVYQMVETIKSRLPRIILYLSVSSACRILNKNNHDEERSKSKIECKCMLMSNAPLPDFHVQFYDQTKLKYSLQSGKLSLSGPTIASYKYSMENTLDWTEIADDNQKAYLLIAQEAMRRCIEESRKKSHENPVVIVDNDRPPFS